MKVLKWAAIWGLGLFALLIVIGLLAGDAEEREPTPTPDLEAARESQREAAREFQRKVLAVLEEGDVASKSVAQVAPTNVIELYRRAKSAHETWKEVRWMLYALEREAPAKPLKKSMDSLSVATMRREDAFKAVMVYLDTRAPSEMVKYQELMERADQLTLAGLIGMVKYLVEIGALTATEPMTGITATPSATPDYYEARGLPSPNTPGLMPSVEAGSLLSRVRYTLLQVQQTGASGPTGQEPIAKLFQVVLRIESLVEGQGMAGSPPLHVFRVQLPSNQNWPREPFQGGKLYLSYDRQANTSRITGVGPATSIWIPDKERREIMLGPDEPLMIGVGTEGLLLLTFRVAKEIDIRDLVLYHLEEPLFEFTGLTIKQW